MSRFHFLRWIRDTADVACKYEARVKIEEAVKILLADPQVPTSKKKELRSFQFSTPKPLIPPKQLHVDQIIVDPSDETKIATKILLHEWPAASLMGDFAINSLVQECLNLQLIADVVCLQKPQLKLLNLAYVLSSEWAEVETETLADILSRILSVLQGIFTIRKLSGYELSAQFDLKKVNDGVAPKATFLKDFFSDQASVEDLQNLQFSSSEEEQERGRHAKVSFGLEADLKKEPVVVRQKAHSLAVTSRIRRLSYDPPLSKSPSAPTCGEIKGKESDLQPFFDLPLFDLCPQSDPLGTDDLTLVSDRRRDFPVTLPDRRSSGFFVLTIYHEELTGVFRSEASEARSVRQVLSDLDARSEGGESDILTSRGNKSTEDRVVVAVSMNEDAALSGTLETSNDPPLIAHAPDNAAAPESGTLLERQWTPPQRQLTAGGKRLKAAILLD